MHLLQPSQIVLSQKASPLPRDGNHGGSVSGSAWEDASAHD